MTARILKCASANSCQKSLTFHFMQAARWVALLLLCSVGIGLTALEFFRHENISWVFLGVCVASGLMLFWLGQCLMQTECSTMKRAGSCAKAASLTTSASVGQTIVRS